MNIVTQAKTFKILKLVLAVLFVAGVVVIAVYRVPNQSITIMVDTYMGSCSERLSADEIAGMSEFTMECENIADTAMKEIRLYRKFKSVCINKITSDAIWRYTTTEQDRIVFNEEACELIRECSQSFLMERLIFAEVHLAIILFLWILLNALEEKTDPVNRNNHGPIHEIKRFFGDIVKYGQFMVYAASADLKAEVANSYLNRLWWLLEPFFNMLVYVIVFGRLMGNSVQNYATFVFSALLMWNFFNKILNYSVKCVRNNRDIVTKVYVPKHVLLISNMILNFFKLLFSLIVLIPMLMIFHVRVGIFLLWLVPAYVLMILLSFGVGMIFLHYGVYIDDLGYAVGILLQMLMFLSGVFYDVIISLPNPLNVLMLCINPVAMFIDTMRNALLYNRMTNVPLIGLWILLSILLSYIGIHIVYKNENGYVKVV